MLLAIKNCKDVHLYMHLWCTYKWQKFKAEDKCNAECNCVKTISYSYAWLASLSALQKTLFNAL